MRIIFPVSLAKINSCLSSMGWHPFLGYCGNLQLFKPLGKKKAKDWVYSLEFMGQMWIWFWSHLVFSELSGTDCRFAGLLVAHITRFCKLYCTVPFSRKTLPPYNRICSSVAENLLACYVSLPHISPYSNLSFLFCWSGSRHVEDLWTHSIWLHYGRAGPHISII